MTGKKLDCLNLDEHNGFVTNRKMSELKSIIDHIVIGAEYLDKAKFQIETLLDAEFCGGGKHPLMATHNSLLKLQENIYMEVISIDPDALPASGAAGRPRWFSLDSEVTRAKLNQTPQPLCWVLSVANIETAKLRCGYDPGEIIEVTRDDLKWRLTVPKDGSLIEEGVLPSLIEWPAGRNPADQMPESKITLNRLLLSHPHPNEIRAILLKLGVDGPVEVVLGKKCVIFDLGTKTGKEVRLDQRWLRA
jgi:hypothetical protein